MSFVFDIAAAQQAKEIGKYNQAIQNRNATIKEQEAKQITDKFYNYDLPNFEETVERLEGETNVAFAKSGVESSGTAYKIKRYNAEKAETEAKVLEHNAKIGASRTLEEANFARMQGNLARMQAKQAEYGYYAKAGESLLRMGGYTS